MVKISRGKKSKLTVPIRPSKKEYRPNVIGPHINVIPFFILCGLKTFRFDTDRDRYALAESFMMDTNVTSYTKALNDLDRFGEYAQNETYNWTAVMDILYEGSQLFAYPDPYNHFDEKYQGLLGQHGHKLDEAKIAKYLLNGFEGKDWHPKTLKAFRKYLPKHDIELFVKLFAITSVKTHLWSNIVNALKAYQLFKKNRSFEGQGFLKPVTNMLYDFRKGNLNFERGVYRNGRRKIVEFGNAILGEKKAVTTDSWLLDACGIAEQYIWEGKKMFYPPRVTEYDLVEAYINCLAECCNYEPRQIVATLWVASKKQKSKFKEWDTEKILQKIL